MEKIYTVLKFGNDNIKSLKIRRQEHLKAMRDLKNGITSENVHTQRRKFAEMRKNPTMDWLKERVKRLENAIHRPQITGFFPSVEDAHTAIVEWGKHVHEGWYEILCIEEYDFGCMDAYGWDTKVWYQFDREIGEYKKIRRPTWSFGTFAFGN